MIDINKKYTTRDGKEVRLYAVDGKASFPVHGAVKTSTGWEARVWSCYGEVIIGKTLNNDLIPIKEKHVRWVNVYKDGMGSLWCSEELARDEAVSRCAKGNVVLLRTEKLEFEVE